MPDPVHELARQPWTRLDTDDHRAPTATAFACEHACLPNARSACAHSNTHSAAGTCRRRCNTMNCVTHGGACGLKLTTKHTNTHPVESAPAHCPTHDTSPLVNTSTGKGRHRRPLVRLCRHALQAHQDDNVQHQLDCIPLGQLALSLATTTPNTLPLSHDLQPGFIT